jgi:hypothetical protein
LDHLALSLYLEQVVLRVEVAAAFLGTDYLLDELGHICWYRTRPGWGTSVVTLASLLVQSPRVALTLMIAHPRDQVTEHDLIEKMMVEVRDEAVDKKRNEVIEEVNDEANSDRAPESHCEAETGLLAALPLQR